MQLLDVNVLIYAFRQESPDHERYRQWLEDLVNGEQAFGFSEVVGSSVIRILTNPKVFVYPDPLGDAIGFVNQVRSSARYVALAPGARHWGIFTDLCVRAGAKGNLVADAYHAALAIEHGCEWITTDRDYARFPGLVWRHPLVVI